MEGRKLYIEAERKNEHEETKDGVHHMERSFGKARARGELALPIPTTRGPRDVLSCCATRGGRCLA